MRSGYVDVAGQLAVAALLTGTLALHVWYDEQPAHAWMRSARENIAEWFFFDAHRENVEVTIAFGEPRYKIPLGAH